MHIFKNLLGTLPCAIQQHLRKIPQHSSAGVPFFALNSGLLSPEFDKVYGRSAGYPSIIAWTHENNESRPHYFDSSLLRRWPQERLFHWLRARSVEARLNATMAALPEYHTQLENRFSSLSELGRATLLKTLDLPRITWSNTSDADALLAGRGGPLNDLGNARISYLVTPRLFELILEVSPIYPEGRAHGDGQVSGMGIPPLWRLILDEPGTNAPEDALTFTRVVRMLTSMKTVKETPTTFQSEDKARAWLQQALPRAGLPFHSQLHLEQLQAYLGQVVGLFVTDRPFTDKTELQVLEDMHRESGYLVATVGGHRAVEKLEDVHRESGYLVATVGGHRAVEKLEDVHRESGYLVATVPSPNSSLRTKWSPSPPFSRPH